MKLTSVFEPGELIPPRFTCDGEDVSPPLQWSDIPPDTRTFALIVDDPDAPRGTFIHWLLYDVPADVRELPEGIATREAVPGVGTQGLNDFSHVGYGGPCPPAGPPHRYVFTLYALDDRLGLAPRQRKSQLLRALRDHVLAHTEIVGQFQRGRSVRTGAQRPAKTRRRAT